MLRKDILKATPTGTADPSEIARFEALAEEWWRPDGAFRMVHTFNAARISWLHTTLGDFVAENPTGHPTADIAGLSILDVGCGAGLVSEALARAGAAVTGIDASGRSVAIATHHAAAAGVPVTYRQALPEAIRAEGRQFDVVLTLEVVEHVADVGAFLDACAALVRPGGLLIVGTLNRTLKSYALAIFGAEYVLGWLPRGTHAWTKFVTPVELERTLAPMGLKPATTTGIAFDPIRWRWKLTGDTSVNYLKSFRRTD